MNKHFLIFLLVLAMCLAYGCGGGEEALSEAPETVGGVAANLAALQDMATKFDEVYNAGDVEGLVSFNYTEGAVRMPPSQPMMVGKAAILGWFKVSLAGHDVQIENVPVEAKVSRDLAYQRGTYSIARTPKAGGDTEHSSGHWVALYERQSEGGWKVICDIWVDDESISTAEEAVFQGEVMSGSESADVEADVAAIRRAIDDWDAALEARDIEKLAGFFAEDAVSISHGTPALVSGRDKIMAPYREELEKYDIEVEKKALLDVRASGDLGMARGVETGTATSKDGEDPIKYGIKWLAIFVRQDDGSWLSVLDFGNSDK